MRNADLRSVDAPRDPRLADAIGIVKETQCEDGRWTLQHSYKGKTYFDILAEGGPLVGFAAECRLARDHFIVSSFSLTSTGVHFNEMHFVAFHFTESP